MIVLDLETSGLDPIKNGILSIGAVDFSNPKGEVFYAEPRLPEGKEIDDKALKINGFTRYDVRDPSKKPLRKVLIDFQNWLKCVKDSTIAGQNPFFDADFLRQAYREEGFDWNFGHRYVDLFSIAVSTYLINNLDMPKKNGRYDVGLDDILWSVGLSKRRGPHGALDDAKLEAEAFSRLMYTKNWSRDFEESPVLLRSPKNSE